MDLGFEWSAKDPSHKSWEGRYEELCDFVKKHGHALVPMGYKVSDLFDNRRILLDMFLGRQCLNR